MSGTYRVAHVTTAHPAKDNRITRRECTSLVRAGIPVALVAVAPEDGQVGEVPLVALPRRRGRVRRMVLGPLDAWRALLRLQPTMIHVHDPELIPLALLWRLSARSRVAVYDAHESLPKQMAAKTYLPPWLRPALASLARGIEKLADRGLNAVVAATPPIAQRYANPRTAVVQNFPWREEFDPPHTVATAPTTSVCYVGAITPERGLAEMIEGVRRSGAAGRLVLAGPASAAAQRLLDDHGGRVEYLGQVNPERVPAIISASAVGLAVLHPMPNYVDSQPTKIFEYMAAGRPFVASAFPYWLDLLGGSDAGVFVDPLDPQAVADAIDQLLADPAEAGRLGANGRAAFDTRFCFDVEAHQLVSLTRELLR